jgi:hypothetical protein
MPGCLLHGSCPCRPLRGRDGPWFRKALRAVCRPPGCGGPCLRKVEMSEGIWQRSLQSLETVGLQSSNEFCSHQDFRLGNLVEPSLSPNWVNPGYAELFRADQCLSVYQPLLFWDQRWPRSSSRVLILNNKGHSQRLPTGRSWLGTS